MTYIIFSVITTGAMLISTCVMAGALSVVPFNHFQDPIYYFVIWVEYPSFFSQNCYHRGGLRCRFPYTFYMYNLFSRQFQRPLWLILHLPLTPLCLVDFSVSTMYVAGYVGLEPLYKIDSLVC